MRALLQGSLQNDSLFPASSFICHALCRALSLQVWHIARSAGSLQHRSLDCFQFVPGTHNEHVQRLAKRSAYARVYTRAGGFSDISEPWPTATMGKPNSPRDATVVVPEAAIATTRRRLRLLRSASLRFLQSSSSSADGASSDSVATASAKHSVEAGSAVAKDGGLGELEVRAAAEEL